MATGMKMASRAFAASVLGSCAIGGAHGQAFGPEQIYERLAPSVWVVRVQLADNKGALGSAVVIAPRTLITNCHVVEGALTIEVTHGPQVLQAKLQYHDPTRDLCQLEVPGLSSPAVALAASEDLHPGQRVYALGNPRGLELTISDGMVSALRRNRSGELDRVQISVPISPGSSGGGLFDVHGRLVGITTSGLRDSQNLNFALPAEWVADLPGRVGGLAVARVHHGAPPQPSTAARPEAGIATAKQQSREPAAPTPPQKLPAPAFDGGGPSPNPPVPRSRQDAFLFAGQQLKFRVVDRLTKLERPVTYEVDRVDADRVSFNHGSRVETLGGEVLQVTSLIAGEFEAAMPPGGWVKPGAAQGATWMVSYRNSLSRIGMELRARVTGTDVFRVAGREFKLLRVDFDGYTTRGGGSLEREPGGRYAAVAWYAPELGRVVRFEARTRGGVGGAAFVIDELAELVAIE